MLWRFKIVEWTANKMNSSNKKSVWKIRKSILLILEFCVLLSSSTFATIITFDDLYVSGGIPVSNPYNGLIWNNFYPQAVNWFNNPNGFVNALLSGSDFVANGGGGTATISSGLFNLNAGYFAAGWRDNLQMQVEGFLNGNLTYSNTFNLSATSGTMINFNCQGVDTVVFSASGGTRHPGYLGDGTFFAMDNLNVAVINAVLINAQPTNYSSIAGNSAAFAVSAYGAPPFTYQWIFNGTNINGATNSSLTLNNVQSCNEGKYSVVVSSLYDSIISSNATLIVTPSPPKIITQPTIQVLSANFNVNIFATVIGSLPIIYQWQFNGTNIDGATNSFITLTNAQLINDGDYALIASNVNGSILSSNVTLYSQFLSMVVGWGSTNDIYGNYAGQIYPPADLAYATRIAAGGSHSLALNRDGTVVGWGDNNNGVSAFANNLSNIVAVAAGWECSLALKADGTVIAWGGNSAGQTNVPIGLSNVVAIAADGCDCLPNPSCSLALKSDGTVVGWGATTVPVGLTNVIAISAGVNQRLALKKDGTIVGWDAEPNIPIGLSNVVAIASGYSFNLALKSDGTVVGWGDDSYGETEIPVGLSNVVAIAAGEYFSLALQSSGTVIAWGAGTGGTGNYPDYGQSIVPPGLSNVIAIAAGARHSLALLNDGSPFIVRQPLNWTVYSGMPVNLNVGVVGPPPLNNQWQFNGTNIDGATNAILVLTSVQPADAGNYTMVASNAIGTVSSSNATLNVITSPPIFASQPTNLTIFGGGNLAFAANLVGSVPMNYQWQLNGTNIVGATNALLTLTNLQWSSEGVYSLVVSNQYGVTTSSNAVLTVPRSWVVAWGRNTYGQTNVPTSLTNAMAIAAGLSHSLALKGDGTVIAWGDNSSHQTNVPAGLSNIVAIAAGGYHNLALKAGGGVVAWGYNAYGQINVPANLTNATAISAGFNHSLALNAGGGVIAWGDNAYGQTNVPIGLSNVVAIAAGYNHNLALKGDGTVVAWGDNNYGQTNVPVGLSNVVAIAAGVSYSLALLSNGTVVAWGDNTYGQTNVPAGLSDVVAVGAGAYHCLAVKSDGSVIAWGLNDSGQTNVPTGLNEVVAVAGGSGHSLALEEGGPLIIASQPVGQSVDAVSSVSLRAVVLGAQPVSYQWSFNGTNIIGATNASLNFVNVQPTNAGNYSLMASNSYGAITSSNAILTVVTHPPAITVQLTNVTVVVGTNIAMNVAAIGTPPLSYQWQFNGTNIFGATNNSLIIINAQLTNQGSYDVIVTNLYGNAISSNAILTVIDLAGALNATNLLWTNAGNVAWSPETTNTHDGVAAASCGPVSYGNQASLQTTVTGPGILTFWWEATPFMGLGYLRFSVDGTSQAGAASSWQQRTFYLSGDNHTLRWDTYLFMPDTITGWLDQVTWTPGSLATIIAPPTSQTAPQGANVVFSVTADGTPPLNYRWRFNGTNIPGATNTSLTLLGVQLANSGNYGILVSNVFNSINASATLTVQPFAFNAISNNIRMTSNGFNLELDGIYATNAVVIYASTNLMDWIPIFTNPPLSGSLQFSDSNALNLPIQFYRAAEQ
ncbi:MAG: immunoglobulin domain-containing protein [Verrucomicrobiota bacterium]|jgi:alpha-tubulin suppressor-like RCC1 family protein